MSGLEPAALLVLLGYCVWGAGPHHLGAALAPPAYFFGGRLCRVPAELWPWYSDHSFGTSPGGCTVDRNNGGGLVCSTRCLTLTSMI